MDKKKLVEDIVGSFNMSLDKTYIHSDMLKEFIPEIDENNIVGALKISRSIEDGGGVFIYNIVLEYKRNILPNVVIKIPVTDLNINNMISIVKIILKETNTKYLVTVSGEPLVVEHIMIYLGE